MIAFSRLGTWGQLGNQQGPQLTLPPGNGHAEIARLEAGSISIEGLTLQAGDGVPAPAASTAAPARPSTRKQP